MLKYFSVTLKVSVSVVLDYKLRFMLKLNSSAIHSMFQKLVILSQKDVACPVVKRAVE